MSIRSLSLLSNILQNLGAILSENQMLRSQKEQLKVFAGKNSHSEGPPIGLCVVHNTWCFFLLQVCTAIPP
jgi:hypothetical protein